MEIIFSVPEYATRNIQICTSTERAFACGVKVAQIVQLEHFLHPDKSVTFSLVKPGYNFPEAFWEGLTKTAVEKHGISILNAFIFKDSTCRVGNVDQFGFTRYKLRKLREAAESV